MCNQRMILNSYEKRVDLASTNRILETKNFFYPSFDTSTHSKKKNIYIDYHYEVVLYLLN